MRNPKFNPYSPPSPRDERPPRRGEELSISAQCVHRGWLGRTIVLSGRIEAVVRYTGWTPGESVFVNDVFVAKCRELYFTAVAPQIEFEIEYGGCCYPATIKARASYLRLLQLVRFALIVDGELVYED